MVVVFYKDANGNFVEIPVSGVSASQVQEAVNTYLSENSINITETDPTIPDWAKEPNKPTYTAEEVNAYTKAEVDERIAELDNSGGSSVTPEQIQEVVEQYLQEHPIPEIVDYISQEQVDDEALSTGVYKISGTLQGLTHQGALLIMSTSSLGSTQLLICNRTRRIYMRYCSRGASWTDWEAIEPTYSKGTIDSKLDNKADTDTTYTKEEVDNLINSAIGEALEGDY